MEVKGRCLWEPGGVLSGIDSMKSTCQVLENRNRRGMQIRTSVRRRNIRLVPPLLLAAGIIFQATMAASPAHAAESVTVPPYEPAVGTELHYRVQKTTETDMSLWFDKPEASSVCHAWRFPSIGNGVIAQQQGDAGEMEAFRRHSPGRDRGGGFLCDERHVSQFAHCLWC